MAFTPISQLFSSRDIQFEVSDIQYGIDAFLQQELRSEKVHCKISGASFRADIRVGSTALAEAVLIRERDLREYVGSHLKCSLGDIRVILDM